MQAFLGRRLQCDGRLAARHLKTQYENGAEMHTLARLTIGCLCVAVSAAVFADALQRIEANNGNLVMEDIPPIPAEIVDSLNRYQNVRSGRFSDWTEDGTGIYISTRFGDVAQIHRAGRD